jgi:hypothetical protein
MFVDRHPADLDISRPVRKFADEQHSHHIAPKQGHLIHAGSHEPDPLLIMDTDILSVSPGFDEDGISPTGFVDRGLNGPVLGRAVLGYNQCSRVPGIIGRDHRNASEGQGNEQADS